MEIYGDKFKKKKFKGSLEIKWGLTLRMGFRKWDVKYVIPENGYERRICFKTWY